MRMSFGYWDGVAQHVLVAELQLDQILPKFDSIGGLDSVPISGHGLGWKVISPKTDIGLDTVTNSVTAQPRHARMDCAVNHAEVHSIPPPRDS